LVSIRMYHGLGEIVRGFTKNGFAIVGRNYFVAILALLFGFFISLLPYGLALTSDFTSVATVILITLTRLVLFVVLGYGAINALFGHPLMIAVWSWIMLRSIGLTGFSPEGLLSRSHSEYVEGQTLLEMIKEDLVAERIAIDSYTEMIRYIGDDDITTRRILESILAVEEEHADDLSSFLADMEKDWRERNRTAG